MAFSTKFKLSYNDPDSLTCLRCTIMLHQPHSQLDASPARSVNSCAPYRPVPTGETFNIHTRHTITAACDIAKMITYAVPLQHHTHFFTCVITMATIVHLSKWALYLIPDEDDLREQIKLSIGALSKLSVIWKAAANAGGQVKGVAQEIYRAKKAQQVSHFTNDRLCVSRILIIVLRSTRLSGLPSLKRR